MYFIMRYSGTKGLRDLFVEDRPLSPLRAATTSDPEESAYFQLGALPLGEGGGVKHSPPSMMRIFANQINSMKILIMIYDHHTQVTTGKNHENHHFQKLSKCM